MQVGVMFIFLGLWLLLWWVGSIALEATGLERGKARFQALSAFSGTGFTTQEAESIVNHPQRRRVAICLIFLGNAGIVAFLILLLLYIRAGMVWPSLILFGIIVGGILLIIFALWSGLVDKLTNVVLSLIGKRGVAPPLLILQREGDYAVVRLRVSEGTHLAGRSVNAAGFIKLNIVILALTKGKRVLSLPSMNERLQPEDHVLCYGKLTKIKALAKQTRGR
jgi:hypothetical protein